MMLTEITFRKIAAQENAAFKIKEHIVSGEGCGNNSVYEMYLSVPYKNYTIEIKNALGAQPLGNIRCNSGQLNANLNFELSTRSHFSSLFFKGGRFTLATNNNTIKQFFKNSAGFAQLKAIANNTTLEPRIFINHQNNTHILTAEYSLQFENKHLAVAPFIQLYKEFIDTFAERI